MGKNDNISIDRIEWLKDVAWNLVRGTRKYDRLSIYDKLSPKELCLLCEFEIKENKCHFEELNKEYEELKKDHEKFMRKRHEEHENHLRFLEELRKGKEMFLRKWETKINTISQLVRHNQLPS